MPLSITLIQVNYNYYCLGKRKKKNCDDPRLDGHGGDDEDEEGEGIDELLDDNDDDQDDDDGYEKLSNLSEVVNDPLSTTFDRAAVSFLAMKLYALKAQMGQGHEHDENYTRISRLIRIIEKVSET